MVQWNLEGDWCAGASVLEQACHTLQIALSCQNDDDHGAPAQGDQ